MTPTTLRRTGLSLLTAAALAACTSPDAPASAGAAAAQPPAQVDAQCARAPAIPIPTALAIPRTETSVPWGACDLRYTPIDLGIRGYLEQEYFLSGTASIYAWPDTARPAVVATAGVPYVTQAMVWYPADPRRFSGTVIVEVGNATAGYDQANVWQQLFDVVTRNGDAYVNLVSQGGTLAKLRQYDAVRYAALTWASPADPTKVENGLFWDILSQAAAWARSPSFPVKHVRTVIATGSSQSSVMLNTYVNAVLPLTRRGHGRYAFDGVLQQNGPNYFPISSSASAPTSVAERGIVPIIRLASSADFANMMGPSDNPPLSSRRDDSDAPGDQYRLYEIACAPHNQVWMNMFRIGFVQLNKVGTVETLSNTRDATVTADTIDFPGWAFLSAQLVNLERWIDEGVAPPRDLPRLAYAPMSGPERIEYAVDEWGNPLGGVRNPWCDVPTATYVPHAYTYYSASWCTANPCYAPPGNFTRNYRIPFTDATLKTLYGKNSVYMVKFLAGLDALVRDRMLLPEDAATLRRQILQKPILLP